MKLRKRLIATTVMLVFLSTTALMAQEKAAMLSVGYTSQLDTYLSPEHYSGMDVRFIHNSIITHRGWGSHHEFTHQAEISSTRPRSKDATLLSGMYSFSFSLYKTYLLDWGFFLSVGGTVEFFLGGNYNTRNGNNPAQLHTGINISPTVKVDYPVNLWNKTFWVTYKGVFPLVGTQFSPAYGQSYYEIFSQGNYDHNICLTHPFNALSYTHQLTIDIPIHDKAIRVGYIGDYRQAKLNDLKYHNFTNGFVIGYVY